MRSHLEIDIASTNQVALGALIAMNNLSHRIKSAHVHARSLADDAKRGSYNGPCAQSLDLSQVFKLLATFPRLQKLTVEFNFNVHSLPISSLITVLKQKSLKKLHLAHLQLFGCGDDFDVLEKLLREQTQLECLSLLCVRGVSAIRSLTRSLPALKEITLSGTALAPYGTLNEDAIACLITPQLEALKLDDVPELDESHIQALTVKLAAPDATLRELQLMSSMLTDCAGKAIAEMLQTNTSIRKLVVHLDAENMSIYMAKILKCNTTLESLDMRMYSDHRKALTKHAQKLATALQYNNSSLKHLRLRLEIELETLPTDIIAAFSNTLSRNESLLSLSLDDGTYRYPLPKPMRLQLQLNRAKIPFLIRAQSKRTGQKQILAEHQLKEALIMTASQPTESAAEEAIQLDMTFHILSNMPSLLLDCKQPANRPTKTTSATESTKNEQQSSNHHSHFGMKVSDWKLPSLAKSLKQRSISVKRHFRVAPRVA